LEKFGEQLSRKEFTKGVWKGGEKHKRSSNRGEREKNPRGAKKKGG